MVGDGGAKGQLAGCDDGMRRVVPRNCSGLVVWRKLEAGLNSHVQSHSLPMLKVAHWKLGMSRARNLITLNLKTTSLSKESFQYRPSKRHFFPNYPRDEISRHHETVEMTRDPTYGRYTFMQVLHDYARSSIFKYPAFGSIRIPEKGSIELPHFDVFPAAGSASMWTYSYSSAHQFGYLLELELSHISGL